MIIGIKYCINSEFWNNKAASPLGKMQHIIESLNLPEAFGDWVDCDFDLSGHFKKWKRVLAENLIMVVMQLFSNMILLVPFFIAGMNLIFKSNVF